MKHLFLIKNNSSALALFFAGWGMDEKPFLHHLVNWDENHPDTDFCICYDYSDLNLDLSLFEAYKTIRVTAWSMGVWAAGKVLAESSLPIREAIAINGTSHPVDKERGITPETFEGTLNGLSDKNLIRFIRRMCGSETAREAFETNKPSRSIESLRNELAVIGKKYLEAPDCNTLVWHKAIIGNQDLIFPAASQRKAWEHHITTEIEKAHYFKEIPFI